MSAICSLTSTDYEGKQVAFCEVHDEPIHVRLFDNEFTWVYKITLEPGVPCEWHRHKEIGVYVVLRGTTFLNTFAHMPAKTEQLEDGFAWSMDCTSNNIVHKACVDVGDKTLEVLAFEILKPAPIGSDSPLHGLIYKLNNELSVPGARVYNLLLGAGLTTEPIEWKLYGVILSMSDVKLSASGNSSNPYADGKLQKYGEWKWFEGTGSFTLTNESEKQYDAILIEWLKPLTTEDTVP